MASGRRWFASVRHRLWGRGLTVATATVAIGAMVVPVAVAQDAGAYHYKGKIWNLPSTDKTPSVGGHALASRGRTGVLPKGAKPLTTYSAAQPVWPAAGSATVTLTQAQASAGAASSQVVPTSPSVKAGSLPVWVGTPKQSGVHANTASVPPTAVRVQVASHAQAVKAGANGLLVGFARTDGSTRSGQVSISLDYSGLDKAYGGGWASRLYLVTVPACALTTPQAGTCRKRAAIASTNDPITKKITATISLSGSSSAAKTTGQMNANAAAVAPMTAVEAISGTSGSQGDYTATSLTPSGTWSATGSGAFTYTYPISVPSSLGGTAPSVALSYDSQAADGETSARNSQSSWIGDGWSYSPGFIERSYKPCSKDGISNSGDLCWGGWIATLSLNGHSGTLVRDDSANSSSPTATQTWHLQGDDGTKIEELSGASNGLWNGEYFKVTTTDGTAYYFGLNHAPGTTSDAATNSAWGEPVYSPNSGDPCYDSSKGQNSFCQMGYRFNLDFAVDTHSNIQRYDYATETNYYDRGAGQVAASGGSGTLTSYVRGGYLTQISYGYQLADEVAGSKPAARLVFNTSQRCQTSSSFTNCSYGNLSPSTASNWPDTPYDLNCPSTDVTTGSGSNVCTIPSPSFWSTYRLDSISTQVNVAGTLTNVDSYQLAQTYSDAGGTVDPVTGQTGVDSKDAGSLQAVMWLSGIQHTGDDTTAGGSSSAMSLPSVSFLGTEIDNRVDGGSQPSLYHPRISSITTETGESIAVTYYDPDCSRLNNTMPSSADTDTMSCYNVYWTIPGGVTPVSDWFNKTRVKTVDVSDNSGAGSTMQVSNYTYSGPAWHRDDSELTDNTYRTWDQFRGYRTVTVTTGVAPDPITQTTTTYLQGMDGDVKADGTSRSVTVTDSVGDTVPDSDWLAGSALETDTYTQSGGTIDAKTVNGPWTVTSTATHSRGSSLPALVSRMIQKTEARTYGLLSGGGWRETETDTTYNGSALPTTVDAKGDVSVSSQEKCTTTSYATPPSSNLMMLAYTDEILTVSGGCGTTPGIGTTISDKRIFYDGDGTIANPGTLGQLGSIGNVTAVQVVSGYSGSTPSYRTTAATTYDQYGRATQATDAAGNATKTAYTPASGLLPTKVVSTNSLGWTSTSVMDPLRELATQNTDTNGRVTTIQYDALGRRTAVWLPDRSTSSSASKTFSYAINGTSAPSTVTTNTLRDDGNYSTAIDIYDGMLQLRQVQSTTANNAAGRLISDSFYDSHGWEWKTNSSYYESTTSPSTTMWVANDNQVPSQTVTVYDGQGRKTASQLWSLGTKQWQSSVAYLGVDRTDSTPASGGTATSTFTNALGQTTASWAYDDTSTPTGKSSDAVVTSYTYTPAGQTASVTDNAGNSRTYSYDILGQLTKQTDPDTGTTTDDAYDNVGNLLQATDARGQTLSYTYDALGRKTAEYSGAWSATPDSTKELASWTYDTLAKGYPTSSTRYVGGAAGSAYTQAVTGYTTDYQPTGESTTIPTAATGFPSNSTGTGSNTYSVSYHYSANMGLLSEVDYGADGGLPTETLGYGYDLQGLLTGFGGSTSYLDNVNYTALGQLTDATWGLYGKQVKSTFAYDAATGRVTQSTLNLQTASSALDTTSYRYNQVGEVTAVSDSQSGGTVTDTQCFTYDQLGRLTTAWTDTAGLTSAGVGSTGSCTTSAPSASTIGGPAPYWQSFTYDLLGDRTQEVQHDTSGNTANDVTQNSAYPGNGTTAAAQPNAVSTVTTTGPAGTSTQSATYDSAGNTTVRSTSTTGPEVSGLSTSSRKICLDDSSSGTTDGNKIQIWTCNGTNAQSWTISTDSTVRVLGKCLDATGDGTANGTLIQLYTCNGSAGEKWSTGANGSLVNQNSGKCLDDPQSSTTNGTQVQLYTCNATNAQRWTNADNGTPMAGHTESFGYDAEGRTSSVITWQGTTKLTTGYLYDASGNLLLQTTPTSKILYLFGGAEQLTLNTSTSTVSGLRYYTGPDGITECRSSTGTLTYEDATTQGTATTNIDASSLAVTRRYFDPYGNTRGTTPSSWVDNRGYLNQPTDSTTNLDLLGARQYDSTEGHFLTADPIFEAGDPNQMGGYTYAANNPTTGSDPTGLVDQCFSDGDGGFYCGEVNTPTPPTPGGGSTPSGTGNSNGTTDTGSGSGSGSGGGGGGCTGWQSGRLGLPEQQCKGMNAQNPSVMEEVLFLTLLGAPLAGPEAGAELAGRCIAAIVACGYHVTAALVDGEAGGSMLLGVRVIIGTSGSAFLRALIGDALDGPKPTPADSRPQSTDTPTTPRTNSSTRPEPPAASSVKTGVSGTEPGGSTYRYGDASQGTRGARGGFKPSVSIHKASPGSTLSSRVSDASALVYNAAAEATGKAKAATWSGAINLETWDIAVSCSGNGNCAEPNIIELTGWDPENVLFVRAMRLEDVGDGNGRMLQEKEICTVCQGIYPENNFVPGVLRAPGGPWGRQ